MAESKELIGELSGAEALQILHTLARDDKIAARIRQIAARIIGSVELDAISEEVFNDLAGIEVEELWDRAGKTRYGYVPVDEAADEMFEEVLTPYINNMERYITLGMLPQAKVCLLGIVKGLYRFEKEADCQFVDWAVDIPREYAFTLVGAWRKEQKEDDLQDKLAGICPEWWFD